MDDKKLDLKEVNEKIRKKGLRWKAGKTKFTDKAIKEFHRHLGLRAPTENNRRSMRSRILRAKKKFSYPSSLDWRDHNALDWTTSIKDQGACGACVAFGVCATMETQWNILNNDTTIDLDLSEAHLFFCGGSCGCMTGWYPGPALDYAGDHGVCREACFPYRDSDMECALCSGWESDAFRVTSWREVTNVAERKHLLASHGPLVGCMDVYTDFQSYTGGIYQYATGDKEGSHCIAIVGYDDNTNCWICKNSWGTGWGESGGLSTESGWFRIGYGECGIDTDWPAYVIEGMDTGGVKDGANKGTAMCCISSIVKGTPYEQDLVLLRNFRDTQLMQSVTAQKYIDLYYKHTDSIVSVLSMDQRSRQLAFSLIDTVIEAIRATGTSREFTFSDKNIDNALELVQRITKHAPPEMRKELALYQNEVKELFALGRGKKITEFTKTVQKHTAKRKPGRPPRPPRGTPKKTPKRPRGGGRPR
jgi:hypothetical protein